MFPVTRFRVTLLLSLVTADKWLMHTMTEVSFIMLPYKINRVQISFPSSTATGAIQLYNYMVYDSMIISLVNKLTTFPHSWHSWNNADDQLINRIVIDKSFTLQDKTLSG